MYSTITLVLVTLIDVRMTFHITYMYSFASKQTNNSYIPTSLTNFSSNECSNSSYKNGYVCLTNCVVTLSKSPTKPHMAGMVDLYSFHVFDPSVSYISSFNFSETKRAMISMETVEFNIIMTKLHTYPFYVIQKHKRAQMI